MKKLLSPLFAILFLTSCGMDEMSDMQPIDGSSSISKANGESINGFNGQPLSNQNLTGTSGDSGLEKFKVIDSYEIQGTDEGGLATGFFLKEGVPAIITASGEVGWYFAGLTDTSTPNGVAALGNYNGFTLISLVARVGGGELQFVGEGPTQLTGSGEVVFYINDTYFEDNTGSYQIEIAYDCFPGFGNGDANHYHCK